MPMLSQGSSVDVTVTVDSTLVIQNAGGWARVESPVGVVVSEGGAASWPVDVRYGTVRITSITGGLYYEITSDPSSIPIEASIAKTATSSEIAAPTAAMLSAANRLVTWVAPDGKRYRSDATENASGTRLLSDQETTEDRLKAVISRGTLLCDWTGTVSGSGYSVDGSSNCPGGTKVVTISGDATTDGTGNPGNPNVNQEVTTSSTANLRTVGIYVMVPPRNAARKNYRNVPIKLMLSETNAFAAYRTLVFNAKADGKWHFYALDISAASTSGFTMGVNTIGYVRVRASVDSGVSNDANFGTAPLQVGETAYIGGVYLNPKARGICMVRFDDSLASLYSAKHFTLLSPYVGQSGVTVAAGSYSAHDLVTAFGLPAAAFVLTRHIDTTSEFESSANLRTLQAAGWEICWQTHYNPVSLSGLGARLLGPLGKSWGPSAVQSHATDGTITKASAHDFVAISGQGTPIKLIGSPPAPLDTSTVYWVRPIAATTFKLYLTEANSIANVSPITFASAGSATWGWEFYPSANDSSVVAQEFNLGKAAMQAFGLNGWMHWAPNQGAFDAQLEELWYSAGMVTAFPTNLQSIGGSPLGVSNAWPVSALGLLNGGGHYPSFFTTMSAYQTDGVSATEAEARAYVQSIATYGGIGQNFHHGGSVANTLVLCAYLDELKLRAGRGEIEVATPSRIARYLAAMRLDS